MRVDPVQAVAIVVLVAAIAFCCGVIYERDHHSKQVLHFSSSSSGENCCGDR